MTKLVKPGRIVFCALLLISLAVVYIVALYKLQIIDGAAYAESSRNNVVTTKNIPAARGDILDRYGRTLISNRACNNILIDTDELFAQDDPNAIILAMVRAVQSGGGTYDDALPITMSPPFEFTPRMTDSQQVLLDAYIANAHKEQKKHNLPEDPTAVDLMAFFRSRYNIDNNYSAEETRIIAGIRYELNIRFIINTSPYVFCEDADIKLITTLMENNMYGFDVEVSYIREYNTSFAAHILGYVGQIFAHETAKYEKLGYPLNAMVGKEGAELAFEHYLHGKDGKAAVTSTASGIVTGMRYVEEPMPGNPVYLTIDIKFQEAAEIILRNNIIRINAAREISNAEHMMYGRFDDVLQLVTGGAVAVIDITASEPLVLASYPTFDLQTLLEEYDDLLEQPNSPLFNRALFGQYPPGSTFKMATAIAALDSVSESTGLPIATIENTIVCKGIYTDFADDDGRYAPRCWRYPYNHGECELVKAIEQSCNYYFYDIGRYLGIDRMSEYAMKLGLGSSTGIELPESIGVMSTQQFKEDVIGEAWFIGDTIQAAIGQSFSEFTPLQLATYVATLVNDGKRYANSLLKAVRTADYSEVIYQREPELIARVNDDEQEHPEYYEAIRLGMRRVVTEVLGTAYEVLGDYPYPIAAKTGTAQLGANVTNNGIFVCYAPYDDPKIAIAVVVEKGGSGKDIAVIARELLDYYFDFTLGTSRFEPELSLLR